VGFAGYNFVWFVIRSASKRLPAFNVGFADNSFLVCRLICCQQSLPFIGYAGYNLIVTRHVCSALPLFISALQTILF